MDAVTLNCPSCGVPFAGKYCAACGEKQVAHHDFTLGHFVEESVEGFTHFDNKLFRSLKLLLFRPGALTRNFEEGRRLRFMKPMQLFIICNVLLFLIVGGSNAFSIRLGQFMIPNGHGISNTRAHLLETFGSVAAVNAHTDVFAEKMAGQSKAFIFLFIPFFALLCALLFLRRRKPIGLHLVFAAHYFSFLLLAFTIFSVFIDWPSRWLHIRWPGNSYDLFATAFNLAVLVVYFALAARRFYRTSVPWAAIVGIVAGLMFLILLQYYRLFLFYNILRTLH
ncbi:MAG: DUF3667 domain-containing protein [Sphingobacteriales bacterium]|nr:MAG: DUF3667 domain-containing protein [Sphingobacteriales bacterium]